MRRCSRCQALIQSGSRCEQCVTVRESGWNRTAATYRRRLGLTSSQKAKQRAAILERDGYACQLCGAQPEDMRELEVDHRTPVALFEGEGLNDPENLWTLCRSCHRARLRLARGG